MNAQPKVPLAEVIIRSVAVGFAYSLASVFASLILGPMSRLAPTLDNMAVWLITGTLVCLALAPFILHTTWSQRATILAVWAVLVFVRALGLGIEGSLFKPTQAVSAIVGAISGTLIGLLVAWLSVVLLSPLALRTEEITPVPRGWWGWTWRVLVVGLAYFIFYFIFGATNALLYTRSFYANNPQNGLALQPCHAAGDLPAELPHGRRCGEPLQAPTSSGAAGPRQLTIAGKQRAIPSFVEGWLFVSGCLTRLFLFSRPF
jgi:hypothetical protein